MPPSRGDVLRELLQTMREAIDLQREERARSRARDASLRKMIREGFQALGAKIDESDSDDRKPGGEEKKPEVQHPPTLTLLPPALPSISLPAIPPATPSETSSVEVRVDARGVRATATATPSWVRAHWKTLAIVALFLWGGVNLVEKAVMLYHRLTSVRRAESAPRDAGSEEP